MKIFIKSGWVDSKLGRGWVCLLDARVDICKKDRANIMGVHLCKKCLLIFFEIREREVLKNIAKAPLNTNPDLRHVLIVKLLFMRDACCVEWPLHDFAHCISRIAIQGQLAVAIPFGMCPKDWGKARHLKKAWIMAIPCIWPRKVDYNTIRSSNWLIFHSMNAFVAIVDLLLPFNWVANCANSTINKCKAWQAWCILPSDSMMKLFQLLRVETDRIPKESLPPSPIEELKGVIENTW